MLTKISVYCTQCGHEIHAVATQLGREVRCPACRQSTILAEATPISEPEDEKTAQADEIEEEPEQSSSIPRRKLSAVEDVDMTPMVDVTFLLLIFFMITAAFALQRSLEIPPPESDSPSTEQLVPQNQEDNSVIVRIMRNNSVWVEDREIPSRQELLAVLREMTSPKGELPPVSTMLVLADGQSRHETVVMVLDAGNAVAMKNIQLKTEDQE